MKYYLKTEEKQVILYKIRYGQEVIQYDAMKSCSTS